MSAKSKWWLFPAVTQSLEDTKKDLLDGKSCALVFFPPVDELNFSDTLADNLDNENIKHAIIYLSKDTRPTIASLCESFGVEERTNLSIQSLLAREEIPAVTLFRSYDELDIQFQKDLITILNDWVRAQHTGVNKSFCLFVPGNHIEAVKQLRPEVKLQTKVLVGLPSATEIQIYTRLTHSRSTYLEARWYEELLASIAGNDLYLLDYLADKKLEGFEDIKRSLCEYLQESDWDTKFIHEQLKDWKPNPFDAHLRLHSIKNGSQLWSRVTIFHPEYGEEIHPLALLLLNKEDVLRHRVWRFQAKLTLPLIDQIRLELYHLLKDHVPDLMSPNGDVPEIGKIKYMLEQLPSWHSERHQYLADVQRTSWVRNRIAHQVTIAKSDYEFVNNYWQKIASRSTSNSN